jgi:hypothetical protein
MFAALPIYWYFKKKKRGQAFIKPIRFSGHHFRL